LASGTERSTIKPRGEQEGGRNQKGKRGEGKALLAKGGCSKSGKKRKSRKAGGKGKGCHVSSSGFPPLKGLKANILVSGLS